MLTAEAFTTCLSSFLALTVFDLEHFMDTLKQREKAATYATYDTR